MCDKEEQWDTAKLLAVKFPEIEKSWLEKVCAYLRLFKGSADMKVQWRPKRRVPRTEWLVIQEEESPSSP